MIIETLKEKQDSDRDYVIDALEIFDTFDLLNRRMTSCEACTEVPCDKHYKKLFAAYNELDALLRDMPPR